MTGETPSYSRRTDELLAPMRALGGLALASTEHLLRLQVENLRQSSGAFLAAWRDALGIRDWHGLGAYLISQGEAAHQVGQDLADASRMALELAHYYADEMRKVVDHTVAGMTRRPA